MQDKRLTHCTTFFCPISPLFVIKYFKSSQFKSVNRIAVGSQLDTGAQELALLSGLDL